MTNQPWVGVGANNSKLKTLLWFMLCLSVSTVHGFDTTDLELEEGAALQVISVLLDVKGNTVVEPADTQIQNFDFSFTCIDSSSGGGPQAVGKS